MLNGMLLHDLPISAYLADREHTSGHILSMLDRSPEDYGRWLAGTTTRESSAAMSRGALLHARLLEPHTVESSFAFYPSRAEVWDDVLEEVVGPRGGRSKRPSGLLAPQDASERGRWLSMLRTTARARAAHKAFMASVEGREVVYPEDRPGVKAAVEAVHAHEIASALLTPEDDYAPELTVRWRCPETGESLQARPDAAWPSRRVWVEVKSVVTRADQRLNTLDPAAVARWAREGWARKSALVHDGLAVVTGERWTGYWVVVEALTHEQLLAGWSPRVSVVRDEPEVDGVPSLYLLGRRGGGGVAGYLDLVRAAQRLRASRDFRPDCVRGVVERWPLPGWLEADLMLEQAPPIVGARRVEVGDAE